VSKVFDRDWRGLNVEAALVVLHQSHPANRLTMGPER